MSDIFDHGFEAYERAVNGEIDNPTMAHGHKKKKLTSAEIRHREIEWEKEHSKNIMSNGDL